MSRPQPDRRPAPEAAASSARQLVPALGAAPAPLGVGALAACGSQRPSGTGGGTGGASGAAKPTRRRRHVGHRQDGQLGQLDRSTWTTTTRPRRTRRWRSSRSRPASRSTYTEDIDDNDSSTARSRPSSRRPGHRPGHHRPHRLDGRPPDPARLRAEARHGQRSRTPRTSPSLRQHVDFDPGRNYSLPWQSGFAGIA